MRSFLTVSVLDRLHDQAGIGPAKAETIVECRLDHPLLRDVGHQIDPFGAIVGIIEIERRGDDLVADREDAEDALDGPRAAEQMPDRRLGAAHRGT